MAGDAGPLGFFSTWPRGRPLTDRDPWWREFTAIRPARARTWKLAADRRERIIDDAVAYMRDACELPWAGEGPFVCGVRAGLCLSAWPFHEADDEARTIAAEALARAGCAERPSWEDAQDIWRGELTEYERCWQCGGKIEGRARTGRGGVATRYCSTLCANSATAKRLYRHHQRVSLAEHRAKCAVLSARTQAIELDCERCGSAFVAGPNWRHRRFCSRTCADVGRDYNGGSPRRPDRPCAQCAKLFHGHDAKQRFCSIACRGAAHAEEAERQRPERQCVVCSAIFRASPSRLQLTCSRRCGYAYRGRGTHPPAKPGSGGDPTKLADDADGPASARRCA